MLNANVSKKWIRWYPEKIFLSNTKNDKNIFFQLNNFRRQDFEIIPKDIQKHVKNKKVNELEIKLLKKEAYERGFQEGLLQDKEKNRILYHKIKNLFLDFKNSISNFENMLFSRLLKTVLIVSSYIISQKINVKDESILLKNIEKIIKKDTVFLKKPKVLIHPENKILIENMFQNSLNFYGWELIYDNHIDVNSCKVISENHDMDTTIDARWQELSRLIHSEAY